MAWIGAACDPATVPPATPASNDPASIGPPMPSGPGSSPVAVASSDGRLAGPWLPAPIQLGDPQIAVVSDACAAIARQSLGEAEADLPTALIDARGGGYVTVILADDLTAIVCFARFGDDGTTATVDSVDRLSSRQHELPEGAKITVDELSRSDEATGPRTIAFGRVGPDAAGVQVMVDDAAHAATSAEGWWSTWWPGTDLASAYSAVDAGNVVVGSAEPPTGEVESRVRPASWWLDPAGPPPAPASTTIRALLMERACASGKSPAGRIDPPAFLITDTTIVVRIDVRLRPGGQDCQGNPTFPFTIRLPERLGSRMLRDGSETPARDVSKPPP